MEFAIKTILGILIMTIVYIIAFPFILYIWHDERKTAAKQKRKPQYTIIQIYQEIFGP